MGYFIGFIVSSFIVGHLAELGIGRTLLSAIISMSIGQIFIYAYGAWWLSVSFQIPLIYGEKSGYSIGVAPYVVGAFLKIVIASIITTSAWQYIY